MRGGRCVVLAAFASLLVFPIFRADAQTPTPSQAQSDSAATWVDRAEEIAEILRQADVVRIEDIGTGVTNPKRAYLAPGGLVESFAWKPIKAGLYRGYWESYTAEIAAYELDKLLDLNMVPVTVERRIDDDLGSAKLWLSPTESFSELGGLPTPPVPLIGTWNLQIIRAKMFDNLIYNLDPNLGNWLVDPSWDIFLIDHSRAFTDGNALAHELTRIDRDLWDRMLQLDEATLTAALGTWLNQREIRAILERRDLMAEAIRELTAAQGDANVFVRETAPGIEGVRPAVDSPTAELVRRAEGAVQTPAFLPPASALLWTGQVVVLAEYAGEHEAIAQQGVERGHALGLLTNDRLAYLAPDPQNGGPLAALSQLVGQQVEVFGPATSADGAIVVQVMRSRPVP